MLGRAAFSANPCSRSFALSISRIIVVLALMVAAPVAQAAQPAFGKAQVEQALKAAETSHDLQTSLPGIETPAARPESEDTNVPLFQLAPPKWLSDLFGSVGNLLFWGIAAVALALVALALARELPFLKERLGRRRAGAEASGRPVSAAPTRQVAAALLEDADRLALSGDYAGAVRLLLFRTIEDIGRRTNRYLPVALTSREILEGTALTPDGHAAFDDIVRSVELSYFGGRAFGAEDYARCRASYERFALAGAAV